MAVRQAEAAALDRLLQPVGNSLRRAAWISALAALIWPAQAAVIAHALGGLVEGRAVVAWQSAGIFAALGLIRAGLGLLADRQAQLAAEAILAENRRRIFQRESCRAEDTAFGGAGAVAALAVEKLDLLQPYVTRYAPARARVAVVPLVILALAFWHSWAVGLVLLVSGPLIPVFMALVGMAAKDASARQMAEIGSLNDLLIERLAALADIRLLGAAEPVMEGFAAQARDLRQRTMAVLRIAFLSSTVLELFAAIGVAMVAVYVGFSLLDAVQFGAWGVPLSATAGMFLLLLAPEFYQPLRDLAAAWHDRAAALAVAADLAQWQEAETPDLPGQGVWSEPLAGPATIRLSGVTMPDGRVLPLIDIAAGESVALVGPSGAGKTTVLRLMAGLLPVSASQVLVAGLPLDDATADGWRARIGWMPQAPHFLNASLRGNLAMGRAGDLAPALRTAAVQDVVQALPDGLNTRLGETGGGLSGGEARRLTLARAIHGAPDVILADEPTADLDAATAEMVTEGLLAQAARGATLVVATHDMALAARMGRIIRLEAVA